MSELAHKSLKEISDGLAAGTFSSREVTDACLENAHQNATRTNAFISILADSARAAAEESDARRAMGNAKSPLDGVPVALKDNMLLVGAKSTSGSNIIKNYDSPYDATVSRKLREAGAVFVGKCNMDEFAMGGSTETSFTG